MAILGMMAVLGLIAWLNFMERYDLISARESFYDPSGQLGIDDVLNRPFAPEGINITHGFLPGTLWVRVTLTPRPGATEAVILLRPSTLDEVRLFEPLEEGGWTSQVTGDRHTVTTRQWLSPYLGFLIPAPEVPRTYYLAVRSQGSLGFRVEAQERTTMRINELRLHVANFFYFAVMLWLIFWAGQLWSLRRDSLLGWFVIMQAAYLAQNLCHLGYVAVILALPVGWPIDVMSALTVPLVLLGAAGFHRALLRRFAAGQAVDWALGGIMLLSVVSAGLILAQENRAGLRLGAALVLTLPVLTLLGALAARVDAVPGRRFLRWIYALLLLNAMSWVVSAFGLLQGWMLTVLTIHAQGIVTGTLMFLILWMRAEAQRQADEALRISLSMAETRLVLEREFSEAQGSFMSMLAHEARNVMGVVRLNASVQGLGERQHSRIDRALHSLDGLIERCQQLLHDTDRQTPELRAVHLAAVLGRVVTDTGAGPRLRLDVAPNLPPVIADPTLLAVALTNLVDNACKYAASGAVIVLAASPLARGGQRGVSIEVSNPPGPAGPPDPQQVFRPFYRAKGTAGLPGSGMGLAMVRRLVRLMGGEVTLLPLADPVTFRVWMPC